MKGRWIVLICVLSVFLMSACVTDSILRGGDTSDTFHDIMYLKNNIHCQERQDWKRAVVYKASYANFTDPGAGHFIVPVNSAVSIETGRHIIITDRTNGKRIQFEFNSKNMGMSADEYVGLIASPTEVSLNAFSQTDRKGIQDGKAYVGMSKDGVRTALGYPAAHRTPSLEHDIWIYWTNRFKARRIEFGENGKVRQVGR